MPKLILGVDIGGTKMNGVVWDGKKVLDQLTVVTPGNLRDFERSLLKLLDFLSAERKISGVGVSMAGLIDKKTGSVDSSPNIRFVKNLPLAAIIKKHGYGHVELDNDAACFLRAELALGPAKKFRHIFGVIAGTGIGGAMFLDGRMYRGAQNFGAEWGRWMIGGENFEKVYQSSFHGKNNKKLQGIFGLALANLINLLNPDCIVVGGGYAGEHWKEFLPQAAALAQKQLFSRNMMPKIFASKLKNAGAIGAALMLK